VLYKALTVPPSKWKQNLLGGITSAVTKLPGVSGVVASEKKKTLEKLQKEMYHDDHLWPQHHSIPEKGVSHEELIELFEKMRDKETPRWRDGFASGAVYHGGAEHTEFLSKVYSYFALTNGLHPDLFPSVRKFEAEVIRMTINMLHGGDSCAGTTTSGGTESILMAMKTYRDWARVEKGITEPEFICATTAHAAFDKSAHYFGMKLIHVPVTGDYECDVAAMEKAITKNTVCLVGSAPAFPHGIIDDITRIAALAKKHKIGCHVDGCLGGFILPFIQQLPGNQIRPWDFAVDGVTSISADTHKYGYAPKGTSVLCFRSAELRKHMYFVATEWPGGIYCSPTMLGSKPGALVAGAWASMVTMGEQGYLKSAKDIWDTTKEIIEGIKDLSPDLYILGDPKAMVVAFASKKYNVYQLSDALTEQGWNLNTLYKPACIHICVTNRHVGKAEKFLESLREALRKVKENPEDVKKDKAAIYGMAATFPDRSMVKDLISIYLDVCLGTSADKTE